LSLSFDLFAVLLLLSPFAAALLAATISRETGRAAGWILAIVPAGLFATLVTTVPDVAAGRPVRIAIDWVPSLDLRLEFLIDGLGLVFALAITGIGTFIVLYSGAYLDGHKHRGRFLAFMLLFMGAMLGLVLSDSLVGLFVFWELTSVTSFLLIGFDHEREAARRGAIQALIVTGIGGLALMAGGVLLHAITGSWTISGLASSQELREAGQFYPWVLGFIVLAAFTKSAQWPFHFWLPNAMEAPTPVSAYLHSATMVQGGVYLLARMSPLLAGTPQWQALLCGFGAITLLWGGLMALKQTDLKQMLAQTTIASLGLSVLLLGVGGEAAAMAVAAYFVAHALYKAALFLVTGIIDHGTGTRDITALGGLRDSLTISFICTGLAALSMFGVPPMLGYLAKEEAYAALGYGDVWGIATIVTLVVGNALLGAVALAVVIRPFMGALKPTPQTPREGGFALWIGPALFGLLGFAVLFAVTTYGETIVAPMASSIAGYKLESHLTFAADLTALPIWLSVVTWVIAAGLYMRLDTIRGWLEAIDRRFIWTWDIGFDQVMFGLVRLAGAWVRAFHHGRLEFYTIVAFALLITCLLVPLVTLGGWPSLPSTPNLTMYEWGAVAMAVAGVATVVAARTRLVAIIALGIQGAAVALIFLFFGAPDLAFTQFMVETLSVVILALVMARLHLSTHDHRVFEDLARDGTLAVLAGIAVSLVLLRTLEGTFDGRLGEFFAENSVALAHGRNIVNVILVDFRGLDTLGEICVVMTAGIGVLAMLRRQHKREPAMSVAKRPRKPKTEAAA
jgi:multicomponent Na+:H+ antiporter subunit A